MVTAGNGGVATIRLGVGDGTFGASLSYSMFTGTANAVSLGDLNGDGVLDLVVAGTTGSGVASIRIGNGNGTFGSATTYSTESTSSSSLSLGDVNGDGFIDLVTAGIGGGGKATVRLGSGNGTFGTSTSYSMETNISNAVTLGDLNGDGFLDLVTAGYEGTFGRATVRMGTGSGTFGSATSYLMQGSAYGESKAVTLGDLNGDGVLDLVTAGYVDSGGLTVRLGVGNGTFGSATSYSTGIASNYAVKLGDLNGDGFLDVVSAGSGYSNVRLGTGNGTFGTSTSYSMNTMISYSANLADLNNDGVLDFITAGQTVGTGEAAIRLSNTNTGVAPLLPFKLTTRADALQALPVLDQKLQQLSSQRGKIGAFQARLQVGVNTLQSSAENYAAADGLIRNTDIAEESSHLIRLNILQNASASILAQANMQPSIALKLLS